MTDHPTDDPRPPAPPLRPPEAAERAREAMAELARSVTHYELAAGSELGGHLHAMEAIAMHFRAILTATHVPGTSSDDLIVAGAVLRNLTFAVEHYRAWQAARADLGEVDDR